MATPKVKLTAGQRCYLDVVRFAAAFVVMFGHATHQFLAGSTIETGAIQGFGVFVFFVISGFLISHSVFDKHDDPSYRFRNFFMDRWFRIYTAYIPALLLVAIVDASIYHSPAYDQFRSGYTVANWVGNLLMMQFFPIFQVLRKLGIPDDLFPTYFGSAHPFWTISVEWWLYMAFGGIVYFFIRAKGRISRATLLIIAFFSIEPLYFLYGGPDNCLSFIWLMGMTFALLQHNLPVLRDRAPWLFQNGRFGKICLLAIALSIVGMISRRASNFPMAELQFSVFLGLVLFGAFFAIGFYNVILPRWFAATVAFLAGYSYSLYLIHQTILVLFQSMTTNGAAVNDWRLMVGAIVFTNIIAMAFAYTFERHHRVLAAWAKSARTTNRISDQLGAALLTR